jgi:signal transduction histidine kinase
VLRTAEVSRANEELRSEITKHEHTMNELRREQVLLRQVLDLHEGDRRVLAYEVHDGLVQYVTGALMRLEAFREGHQTGRNNAWDEFDASLGLLRETVAEARRLISGLRPPILDEAGIADALDYLASEHRQAGLQVEAVIRIASKRLASPLETAIFRIVQEGLTNIRRHSQSDRAMIEVTELQDSITVQVRDWGIGFRPEVVDEKSFGLRGIRERVRLLGGQFQLQSAPGKGTTLEVNLPTTPPPS